MRSFSKLSYLLPASLLLGSVATAQVANDDCASAIVLPPGAQLLVTDTSMATVSGVNPACGGTPPADIWYEWTADADGEWQFTMCNTILNNYDARLALWSACGGVELDCNDDGPMCNLGSHLSVPCLVSGTTYLIQVAGWNQATGTATTASAR